jgi:adenylate cyclase
MGSTLLHDFPRSIARTHSSAVWWWAVYIFLEADLIFNEVNMAVEIERKFLLADDQWREQVLSKSKFSQGYLSLTPERTVRVRVADGRGWLTVKGKSLGASRAEFEYEIPSTEAQQMLDQLCEQPIIEKWRYRVEFKGHLWEIDEFSGDNAGLIVAEVELTSEDEEFFRPHWLGHEVTNDHRYFNSNLIKHPFKEWNQ